MCSISHHSCFIILTVNEAVKRNEQLAAANAEQEERIASLKKVGDEPP